MLKNLETATNEELSKMLEMAIGRAFRMATLGRESEALKAARDAKEIGQEQQDRVLATATVVSTSTRIDGRARASDKELATVWGQM